MMKSLLVTDSLWPSLRHFAIICYHFYDNRLAIKIFDKRKKWHPYQTACLFMNQ